MRVDDAAELINGPLAGSRVERELAALRRLYDVARRRYGRDVALDMAMDAVEEARR